MQGLDFQFLKLGIELMLGAFVLIPSYSLTKTRQKQHKQAKEKVNALNQCIKNKQFIYNKNKQYMGIVTVNPVDSQSLARSFKRTKYFYHYYQLQNLNEVTGSYFFGNIEHKCSERNIPQRALVDLRLFSVDKKALQYQSKVLNQRNAWSNFLDQWTRKELVTSNRYSLAKATITLNFTSLAIYGQIKIDEVANLTKIVPEYIASSYSEIIQHYEQLRSNKMLGVFGGVVLTGIFLFIGYFILKNRFSCIKQALKKKKQEIVTNKIPYILSDPQDKLHCRRCKTRYSNIILKCFHLSVCQECYTQNKNCAYCGEQSLTFTKIFIS